MSTNPNAPSPMREDGIESIVQSSGCVTVAPPALQVDVTYDMLQTNKELDDRKVLFSPALPPSLQQVRFNIVLRRQRLPVDETSLKFQPSIPSRFNNLSNAFEFAGWGSLSKINLTPEDYIAGKTKITSRRNEEVLGQFTGGALAGNAVLGSVFYAVPALVAVVGVYSPISMFIATLVLFIWRPIMEELASALPISGAPYTFLLNTSTKSVALIGASLLLLDFSSTSVVSAATAATYLAGEVKSLPFPEWVVVAILLLIFTAVSLTGIKESARIALIVLSLHMATMITLIVAAIVYWGKIGIGQLRDNWKQGHATATSAAAILKQVYYGLCLGMLGLTGFECVPAYIARIKHGHFPLVMRNLHIPAIFLNTILVILLLAVMPLQEVDASANVLSVLSEVVAGRWLRVCVVVDAIVVLSGGILTGILSACELLGQLAQSRVLPRTFLVALPVTGAPFLTILSFVALCGLIYASAMGSLSVISLMFSLVWLTVMSLFPLSLLLLRFNRGRVPRQIQIHLGFIFAALIIIPLVFAGNIAVNPKTAGYFSAYFICVITVLFAMQNKVQLLRYIYWLYDQYPVMHRWGLTESWGSKLIAGMKRLKNQPLCILTKTDEINRLFQMVSYVQKNEVTSCIKIIHFYAEEEGLPSELEANAKILDEAFPETTIDLFLIQGEFNPESVAALAHHLNIPTSLMFMGCPGRVFKYSVADFGTRIISM
ncbi:hypothetical protein AX15_000265 [Amanita polypyramis BW_CC]|nr:hypothetical protein AX15_000265 [Amanita polypyramis BW_CC]